MAGTLVSSSVRGTPTGLRPRPSVTERRHGNRHRTPSPFARASQARLRDDAVRDHSSPKPRAGYRYCAMQNGRADRTRNDRRKQDGAPYGARWPSSAGRRPARTSERLIRYRRRRSKPTGPEQDLEVQTVPARSEITARSRGVEGPPDGEQPWRRRPPSGGQAGRARLRSRTAGREPTDHRPRSPGGGRVWGRLRGLSSSEDAGLGHFFWRDSRNSTKPRMRPRTSFSSSPTALNRSPQTGIAESP